MLCCDYLLRLKGFIPTAANPRSQLLVRDSIRWTLFSAPRSQVFPGGRQDPVTSLCVWYKVLVSGPQVGQPWKGIAVAGHPRGWLKAVTVSEPTLPLCSIQSVYFSIDVHTCMVSNPSLFPGELKQQQILKDPKQRKILCLTPRELP